MTELGCDHPARRRTKAFIAKNSFSDKLASGDRPKKEYPEDIMGSALSLGGLFVALIAIAAPVAHIVVDAAFKLLGI